MTDHEIVNRVRQFMGRSFEGRTLADDDDIFALGFGNSLFAMQLVAFIEKDFNVEVDSDDLEIDNFRSIGAVSSLVGRKLAACQSDSVVSAGS